MKALSYIKENNQNIPFELGAELGYGIDGQVFSIKNDHSKVIKISTLYQSENQSLIEGFEQIKASYEFLMLRELKCFAKVFDIKFLFSSSRKTFTSGSSQNYIVFYSILEKLNKPSEDENKVLKSFCDHFNSEYEPEIGFEEVLSELSHWFVFDSNKILEFYHGLMDCPIIHNDVHRRNIMKDNQGNFKLIDFDRMTLVTQHANS